MKEHEDDIVTKTERILSDRDEGEDMMVDIVGADDDNHGTTGVNLVSKSGSDWFVDKCSRKETDSEQVADSVGIRVLNSERETGTEQFAGSVRIRVLNSEKEKDTEQVAGSVGIRVLNSEKETDREHVAGSVGIRVLISEKETDTEQVAGSVGIRVLNSEKETDTEQVAGSVGIRVLSSEKDEAIVNEERLKTSAEGNILTTVAGESNGDVAVSDTGEVTERGFSEEVLETHVETVEEGAVFDTSKVEELRTNLDSESLTTFNLGPEELLTKKNEAQDSYSADPRVIQTDDDGQNCKVELPITSDVSRPVEEQGLKVEVVSTGSIVDATVCVKSSNDGDEIPTGHIKISNSGVAVQSIIEMNGFTVSTDVFEEIDGVTPIENVAKDSEYSYEDNEGMDIDEVLGWKDDEHYATSEAADVVQKLLESSRDPVLIGHQEETLKSREPIVYGRHAHVEVPVYDESVQEHEHQLTERSIPGSSFSLNQSRYFPSPEHEGEFSVSDLVWGKVKSHPWWPGQIIDPSNASNMAMKYHKKNCFLVAYFGDGTFAWNDSTVLKSFRANFSQIQKHTNSEAFKNAVECAMEEMTRRIELGLTCSCVSKDVFKKIEYQVIENGGVRKRYYTRYGKDESCSSNSFEPDKLVEYLRLLARFPDESDKMELAIAKAQLSSYCRFKGYRELPKFQFYGVLLEDAEKLDKKVENAYPNKEISLSDLTDETPESGYGDIITIKSISSSGYKKRKARDSISNGSMKRPNRQSGVVSTPPISVPKPSFKIGALIQRVASQLTGPTPLKSDSENGQHVDQVLGSTVSLHTPENLQREASVAEMLSQLHLTAQDPMKRYGFLQTIIPFFYNRRAAIFSKSLKKNYPTIEKPVSSMKTKASNENDPEEFKFDEINDSYWTERIIQNHSEDHLQQDNQNGGIDFQQVVANEQDKVKPTKRGRKKRVVSTDHKVEVKVESEVDKKRRENLATEVVLKFAEGIYFPPEIQLNKTFRRFGSLMESETEVDRQGGRARVVFRKCCDAEVAHSSAGKINIFGSIDVKYELNYTPLVSYKPLPLLL